MGTQEFTLAGDIAPVFAYSFNPQPMNLKEQIIQVWDEVVFWLKRNSTKRSLVFWIMVFVAAFIRWLYFKYPLM